MPFAYLIMDGKRLNTMGKHIDGSVATLDAKVDALNTNMGILLETHLTVRNGNGRP